MPIVPQPNSNGVVRSLGFSFNFSNAFATTAQLQGVPVNTSFSNLQASLGTSTDLYPTQLTAWGRANQGVGAFTTLTTANAVGQVGAVSDVEALNTSLWAYAKQTYLDAQTAATNANAAFSLATTADANANTANTNFITLTTANAIGQVGTSLDAPSLATSVWAYAKQTQASLSNLTTANAVGQVGTISDTPSLTTSLWAYAKQAEIDAQVGITFKYDLTVPNCFGGLGTDGDTPSLTTSTWAYAKQAQITANKALTYNVNGTTLTGSWTQGIPLLGAIPTTFTVYPSTANLFGYWTFNAPANTNSTDSFLFNLNIRFDTTNQHTSAFYYAYQIGTSPDVNIQPWDDTESQIFTSSKVQVLILPLILTGNFTGATIKVKIYVKSGGTNTVSSLPSVFPATVQIISF